MVNLELLPGMGGQHFVDQLVKESDSETPLAPFDQVAILAKHRFFPRNQVDVGCIYRNGVFQY